MTPIYLLVVLCSIASHGSLGDFAKCKLTDRHFGSDPKPQIKKLVMTCEFTSKPFLFCPPSAVLNYWLEMVDCWIQQEEAI